MRFSANDDVVIGSEAYELGHMVKEWSMRKAARDMKRNIPNYHVSAVFQEYLKKLQEQQMKHMVQVSPMNTTVRKSTLLMHSQERNRHNKVFGGYLMRLAFDMAMMTASLHQKNNDIQLWRVD